MNNKNSLRKYLVEKRLDIYEQNDIYTKKILSQEFTEKDVTNMEISNAQLNLINEIFDFCVKRGRF